MTASVRANGAPPELKGSSMSSPKNARPAAVRAGWRGVWERRRASASVGGGEECFPDVFRRHAKVRTVPANFCIPNDEDLRRLVPHAKPRGDGFRQLPVPEHVDQVHLLVGPFVLEERL